MKKLAYTIVGIALILGLTACKDDPSIDNHPKEQITAPNNNKEEARAPIDQSNENSEANSSEYIDDPDASEQMASLPFTDFDLEVKYSPTKKFDVDYEQKNENGRYEAEIKDDINNAKLVGKEAFNSIYNQFKNVELTKDMPQEEVIQTLLKSFELDGNYTEFDVDYTLKDGTKVDFEDKK